MVLPEEIDVAMSDVGGLDDVKVAVEELFLMDIAPEYMTSRLLTPPKGVLFHGPPGLCVVPRLRLLSLTPRAPLQTMTIH